MPKIESAKNAAGLKQELAILNRTLEENISALEEAQALTHLGSWQWNVASGAVTWSDELYRIYGMRPQERQIGYEEFLELIHPEDRERIGGIIYAAFQSGKPFDFEHRIILPNKKVRVLYGKGKAVSDEAGTIIRMVGTSQDITERKKADQALHLSDERFKAVTAATNDVVYDIDLDGNKTWFNEAFHTEYGYSNVAPRTLDWQFSRIHPEDRQRVRASAESVLAGKGSRLVTEYRLQKHDDTYIDVQDRAFVLRDTEGRPIRIIGSILDVTQQKELGRAKDKFISLVSHQLRTPLTAMRLLSDLLAHGHGGALTKTGEEYVDKINTSTVRMIQLVGDILNVSQIERGQLKVVPVLTDIQALVQWHVDEVAQQAVDKKCKILFTPRTDVTEVAVDPILFSQIIHNLLNNAIRYTKSPDTTITVTFAQNEEGSILSVCDQGIGIPQAVQKKIFSSFFRADNAVKMHGEGTGLGLHLVKLIMDATGGDAWFDSQEGKGTKFYVSLPPEGMRALDYTTKPKDVTHG